jgi:hypothetical protein
MNCKLSAACISLLLFATHVKSQTLWNTNQKWSKPTGIPITSLQKISFTADKKLEQFNTTLPSNIVKTDTLTSFSGHYDSTQQKPVTRLDTLKKEYSMNVSRIALLKGDSSVMSARQLGIKKLDTLNATPAANSAAKMNHLKDSTSAALNVAEVAADSATKSNIVQAEKKTWLEADQFARKDTSKVKNFVQTMSKADTTVINEIVDLRSSNADIKNLSYILLAIQDTADINAYYDSLRAANYTPGDSLDIRIKMADIATLVNRLTGANKYHISLFASGDFLNTLQNSTGSSNNSILSGSLGIIYTNARRNLSIMSRITLLSTQDTVINSYGSQILTPAKGKGFGTAIAGISYSFKQSPDTLRAWAFNATVAASSQHWRLDSSQLNNVDSVNSTMNNIFTEPATILGADITLSHHISVADSIPVGGSKYPLSFGFNAGIAERILGGDILKPLKNNNSMLYKIGYYADRLPTTRNKFFGFEAGSSISLGPVMTEFEVYYFPSNEKDKQPIYGLTGLQVAFGASINLNFYHN